MPVVDLLSREVWLLIECLETVAELKCQAKKAGRLPCKPAITQALTTSTSRRDRERLRCPSLVLREH